MFEDLIVELRLSFDVEGETADLAFGFTAGGHVVVVFGSSGTELDEDDRIGVGIENPLTKMIEGAVEMESGMAGGEAGHGDVEIGRIEFAVLVHLVMDLDPFFSDGADPAHVVSAAVQELPEIGRIDKFFDLCLVGLLPELTSHGIQHEFSQSTLTRIFADVGTVEDDVFAFLPSLDVPALRVSCGAMLGYPLASSLSLSHVSMSSAKSPTCLSGKW